MSNYFISATAQGERCWCGKAAIRKVGEEIPYDDPQPNRHNLTAYICEEHFLQLMGHGAERQLGMKPKPRAAQFLADVLNINVTDLPEDELDFPVIEGDSINDAIVKFMSDSGTHDEELADRFEVVLQELNAKYNRLTPRLIKGDLSGLEALAAQWED